MKLSLLVIVLCVAAVSMSFGQSNESKMVEEIKRMDRHRIKKRI